MKVTKLNSPKIVTVNVSRYLCDWNRVVSKPQKQVKDFLQPFWKHSLVLEEFRIPGSRLRIDLLNVNRRIAVEVSPAGSHSFNPFFHKHRPGFGAAVARELDKEGWCRENGFAYIEIGEDDFARLSWEWVKSAYDIEL